MVLYIFLGLTILVILVLITPLHLNINTTEGKLSTGIPGVLWMKVILSDNDSIKISLWLFFFRFTIYPFKRMDNTNQVRSKKSLFRSFNMLPKWKRVKLAGRILWQTMSKSKLKKLYVDLDTQNVITNAYLYPVFAILNNRPKIDLNVNYSGKFSLILDLRNNLLKFILIILKNLVKR